jgi:hypothetical protein
VNLLKHLIWAITAMTAVAVIAIETREYNIEDAKQDAFMMKACVDAGGEWQKAWNGRPSCLRPAPRS